MEGFFSKIRASLKNNPITTAATIVDAALSGGGGYILVDYLKQYDWAQGPWGLVTGIGGAFLMFIVLTVLTIRLGHDSPVMATIRKCIAYLGQDKAVVLLGDDVKEEDAARKAAEEAEQKRLEEEAILAAAKKEEDDILAAIAAEEAEKARKIQEAEEAAKRAAEEAAAKAAAEAAERERQAKIAAYKAAHPELFGGK